MPIFNWNHLHAACRKKKEIRARTHKPNSYSTHNKSNKPKELNWMTKSNLHFCFLSIGIENLPMQVHFMPNTFFSLIRLPILFIYLKSQRLPFIEPIKAETVWTHQIHDKNEKDGRHEILVWDISITLRGFWIMHKNSNRICFSDISLQAKISVERIGFATRCIWNLSAV